MFYKYSRWPLVLLFLFSISSDFGSQAENELKKNGAEASETNDGSWNLNDEVLLEEFVDDGLNPSETNAELAAAFRRYRVHTRARQWFDAVSACWRRGQRLATPRDKAEAQLLGQVLAAATATANITNTDTIDAMHIGFHDLGLEGRWYTTEGEPLTFSEWVDDAIFTRQGQWLHPCAAVIGDGRFLYQSTSQKLIYACDTQPPPLKKQIVDITDGYSAVAGGRRFKLYMSPLPWLQALEACEKEGDGAALAAPPAPEASSAAIEILRQADLNGGSAFVGFSDLSTEGDWRDARGNYAPVSDNWDSGEPNGGRSDNCVEMTSTGKYRDVSCSDSKPFLCEKIVIEEEQPEYITIEGLGKYGLHKKYKSWMSALMKCRADNGTLALPKSQREADALKRLVFDTLGESEEPKPLDYPDWRTEFIIGVHDLDGDGEWSTIEGVSLMKSGYNEWLRYNPTFHQGLMKCGGLSYGKFVHIQCDSVRMYICQKPL